MVDVTRCQQYGPQISQIAAQYGIPQAIVGPAEAIMAIESQCGQDPSCSPDGYCGLMQTKPGTGSDTQQLTEGVTELWSAYGQCHTWEGAAAAYFSGSCDTSSAKQDSFGTSVTAYVSRFDQYLSELGGAANSPVNTTASGTAGVSTAQLTAELTKGLKAGGLYLAAIGLIAAGVWIL